MVWYKDLYVGRMIAARKDSVIDSIERGEYPSGVYVILIPENENSQLEIMSAREFRHAYVRKNCLMIVGLGLGRTEARTMIEGIVGDVYRQRGDADIRAWLSEEHE